MKRTTLLYCALFAGTVLSVVACKKSFLTVNPEGTQIESDYYQTPDEAFAGLVAAYNPLS